MLRFRTEGVTHVIPVDEDGVLTLLFTTSADGQGYRPRYGLGSQSGGTLIASQAPPSQFERAVGMGWLPVLDVPADEIPAEPGRPRSASRSSRRRARSPPTPTTPGSWPASASRCS